MKVLPNIVSIQPGVVMAWAVLAGDRMKVGKAKLEVEDKHAGDVYCNFVGWLNNTAAESSVLRPTDIVIPLPLIASGVEGYAMAMIWRAMTLLVAARFDIQVYSYYPTTVKQYATGGSVASMDAVMASAIANWPSLEFDDYEEAMAIYTLDYHRSRIVEGKEVPE